MTMRLHAASLTFGALASLVLLPVCLRADPIFNDDFNDGVISPSIITAGNHVSEHSGVLDIQNAVTDAGGTVGISFPESQYVKARFKAFVHIANEYSNPSFAFNTADGGAYIWNLQRHNYNWPQPEYYNHPLAYTGGTYPNIYSVSEDISSDFWDQWIDVTMTYDSNTGVFVVTYSAGDKLGHVELTVPTEYRGGITSFYINPAGWWTGHYIQIDDLSITSTRPEPPLKIATSIMLRFDTIEGRMHTIQDSTDLKAWSDVVTDIAGDGTEKKYFFEITDSKKFYRLKPIAE